MTYTMTMEKIKNFKLEFVHYMPKELNQGVLYISMEYSLVMHLCACGCGEKVATPLSPEDWKLYYDGEAITLSPSVGNWDFPCESHYWIKKSKIIYAERWNEKEIQSKKDKPNKQKSSFQKSNTKNTESAQKVDIKRKGWKRFFL